MEQETTQALVDRARELTEAMHDQLEHVRRDGQSRRDVWAELNRRGISQARIADACGVVEHTVYTELRRRREEAAQ